MEEATPIVREKLTTGIAGRFQLLPPSVTPRGEQDYNVRRLFSNHDFGCLHCYRHRIVDL